MAADTISRGRLRRLAEVRPPARPGPLRLLQPRPERVRHARRARHGGHLRDDRGRAQGRRGRGAARPRRARRRCAPTSSACARSSQASDVATNGTHGLACLACGRPTCSRSSGCRIRSSRARSSTTTPVRRAAPAPAPTTSGGACCSSTARSRGSSAARRPGWRRSSRSRTTRTRSTTRAAGRRRTTSARSSRRSSTTSSTRSTRCSPTSSAAVRPPGRRRAGGLAGEVEDRLHPYLRERLAGRISIDVENTGADDVQAAAAVVVEGGSRRASARRSTAWRRASAAATAALAPRAVMEALEQARVEILLLAEDFDAPELDEAVEQAITQSAEVLVVRHHDDLEHARRDRRRASLLMARALLIVDFQNDFTPPAARSRSGRRRDRRPRRRARRSGEYDLVVATATGIPPTTARSPPRAARGPSTACRARRRRAPPVARPRARRRRVDKGQDPAPRATRASRTPGLAELLRERDVDHVTVVGLATDYCVKNTALDALRAGSGSPSTPPPCAAWTSRPATPTGRWRSCAPRGRASRGAGAAEPARSSACCGPWPGTP